MNIIRKLAITAALTIPPTIAIKGINDQKANAERSQQIAVKAITENINSKTQDAIPEAIEKEELAQILTKQGIDADTIKALTEDVNPEIPLTSWILIITSLLGLGITLSKKTRTRNEIQEIETTQEFKQTMANIITSILKSGEDLKPFQIDFMKEHPEYINQQQLCLYVAEQPQITPAKLIPLSLATEIINRAHGLNTLESLLQNLRIFDTDDTDEIKSLTARINVKQNEPRQSNTTRIDLSTTRRT